MKKVDFFISNFDVPPICSDATKNRFASFFSSYKSTEKAPL